MKEGYYEFAKALGDLVQRKARNVGELLSFEVRPGVTFPGIEVFFGNRVAQVEADKLDRLLVTGQLDKFVGHLFHNILRGKTLAPWSASQYRRQDVVREIAFSYRRCLAAAKTPEEADSIMRRLEREVREEAGAEIPDVALYTQLTRRLELELPALLTEEKPEKRGPGRPRKEVTIDA